MNLDFPSNCGNILAESNSNSQGIACSSLPNWGTTKAHNFGTKMLIFSLKRRARSKCLIPGTLNNLNLQGNFQKEIM